MIYIIMWYIVGCVLSYGRITGSYFAFNEKYNTYYPINPPIALTILMTICSWLGFMSNTIVFLVERQGGYFFRWTYKGLNK